MIEGMRQHVTTAEQLRVIVGEPIAAVANKVKSRLSAAQLDHETEKICTGPTFNNTVAREAHHRDTRQHYWPPGRCNAHEGTPV